MGRSILLWNVVIVLNHLVSMKAASVFARRHESKHTSHNMILQTQDEHGETLEGQGAGEGTPDVTVRKQELSFLGFTEIWNSITTKEQRQMLRPTLVYQVGSFWVAILGCKSKHCLFEPEMLVRTEGKRIACVPISRFSRASTARYLQDARLTLCLASSDLFHFAGQEIFSYIKGSREALDTSDGHLSLDQYLAVI